MRMKNRLFALLIVMSSALPAVAEARTDVSIGVNIGPPAAPTVVAPALPAPQPGYVWAPGYWAWDGYRYVWAEGRWMAPRPGYVWVGPSWVRRGPRWYFVEGRWAPGHHPGHRW